MLYYFVFNRKGDTMDTYYEDILNKVEQLIAENDIQNAFCILEEELSMPYIPKAYEDRLISLYNDCRSQINESRKSKKLWRGRNWRTSSWFFGRAVSCG